MKKKIFLSLAAIVILAVIGGVIHREVSGKKNAKYLFGEVTRGNLEHTISSSGTLSPVTTIEVGTQVSGIIARIYADFNDKVTKGQLLAVLDTVMLKAAVLDARANVEKVEAQLEKAQDDYDRNKPLYENEMISRADFLPYSVELKTGKANLKSAQASLSRTESNLRYAVIRAPISGTVTQRNVEAGQTVAASFSTPTLFKIAEDLSQMEILADVDESDIGSIREGQPVRFDVQAYADKKFTGIVKQIRLEPKNVSNVVTYTAVIRASNEGSVLLPGMTATIDFITEQKTGVLLVPNAALRFQPSEKVVAAFMKKLQETRGAPSDSTRDRRGAHMESQGSGGTRSMMGDLSGSKKTKNIGQVWYLDQDGKLAMETVRIGTSDGTQTEIVKSRNLREGIKVITGTEAASAEKKSSSTAGPGFGGGRGRLF